MSTRFARDKSKGAIAETIAEELFRDLGFYIVPYGKEITASPLAQLPYFLKSIDMSSKFSLKENSYFNPMRYIDKAPDFIVTYKDGKTFFLEVKYRTDGGNFNSEKIDEVFEIYPETIILIINPSLNQEQIKKLRGKDTRFVIRTSSYETWDKFVRECHQSMSPNVPIEENKHKKFMRDFFSDVPEAWKEGKSVPLDSWLRKKFAIDAGTTIKDYEKLVNEFFSQEQ